VSEAIDNQTVVLEHTQNALPTGTRFGEFEIIGLVGEGGFGIVYLAQDHSLERRVALKEYMPALIASRAANASVAVRSEQHRETFEIGRRSFVNEAHLLARFDHPALVKVHRFWEDNGTAYMVMPYYEGRTLREALKAHEQIIDESWIRKILVPVIDALEVIHRDNCFHRDIAPDNIMLLRDDRPVLLDFGAARRVIGDMTQALTAILKPGFAPVEQYSELPGMKQGAWTDVYALAAVIHFMILGKTPPSSIDRMMQQDAYQPLATVAAGRFSDTFLRGVDHCLAVRVEDRPQTMEEMRKALGWEMFPPLVATVDQENRKNRGKGKSRCQKNRGQTTISQGKSWCDP
jgi:serine/threonine protein kinase